METKIFLLAGKARSGKDAVGKIIQDYYEKENKKVVKFGFGDYIKWYAMKITDWNGKDTTKPRELLQTLGTDIVRNQIDKDFFIRRICEDIMVYKYYFDVIIITGARFPNELDIPKEKFDDTYIIKMERPNFVNELTDNQKEHSTETALENYKSYDYLIENNEDMEELKHKVTKVLEEINNEY